MVTKLELIELKKDDLKYKAYLEKKRISRRKFDKLRKENNICLKCYKEPICEERSKWFCVYCIEKNRIQSKNSYHLRRKLGLCVNCGSKSDGKLYCINCKKG